MRRHKKGRAREEGGGIQSVWMADEAHLFCDAATPTPSSVSRSPVTLSFDVSPRDDQRGSVSGGTAATASVAFRSGGRLSVTMPSQLLTSLRPRRLPLTVSRREFVATVDAAPPMTTSTTPPGSSRSRGTTTNDDDEEAMLAWRIGNGLFLRSNSLGVSSLPPATTTTTATIVGNAVTAASSAPQLPQQSHVKSRLFPPRPLTAARSTLETAPSLLPAAAAILRHSQSRAQSALCRPSNAVSVSTPTVSPAAPAITAMEAKVLIRQRPASSSPYHALPYRSVSSSCVPRRPVTAVRLVQMAKSAVATSAADTIHRGGNHTLLPGGRLVSALDAIDRVSASQQF